MLNRVLKRNYGITNVNEVSKARLQEVYQSELATQTMYLLKKDIKHARQKVVVIRELLDVIESK